MQEIMIHFYKDNRETVIIKGSSGHVENYWNGNIGHLTTLIMNGSQFPDELPLSISPMETLEFQNVIGQLLWVRGNSKSNQITKSITFNASEISQYLNNVSIRLASTPRVTDGHINARFDNIKEHLKGSKRFSNSFELVVQYVVNSLQGLIAIELLECIRRDISILKCKCSLWYIKHLNNKTCGLCPPPTKTSRYKMPENERNLERFKGNLTVYVKRQANKKGVDVKLFISNKQNEIDVIKHLTKYIEAKKYMISEKEIKYWLNKLIKGE